jgi:hypothetical protein
MSCNNVNCSYSDWVKLPCLNNDKLIKLRTIITPSQGTTGTSCDTNQNNYIDTETCILPKNCELSDWSGWSPCSSGKQIKTRQVKNPPKIGGDVCPESLTAYFETQNCTANNTTTGTCTYTDWSDWSPCTTVAGIGYQVRTRGVQTAGGNCSNNYQDYVQKQTCNNNLNNNCVLSDWSWSPCSTKCGTGFKIGTRKILENAKNGGQLCPIDINSYYIRENCTSNEYCPINCIDTNGWTACNNNTSSKIITPAQNCGICPSSTSETRTCNDCTVGWSACNGVKRTKVVTQATNGGIACTPDQNAPAEQSCNNCSNSDWFSCSIIPGSTEKEQRRLVIQATNGGTACTAEQNVTRKCCLDCTTKYNIIKNYYDTQGQWRNVFTMDATNSNKVSETQCDVAYNYTPVPGGGRRDTGTDKRRFTLSVDNPTNCTWKVTGMGEYQSGRTV